MSKLGSYPPFRNVIPENKHRDNGEWVALSDVKEIIEALQDARLVVDGVCDEYKGYLGVLRKIDMALARVNPKILSSHDDNNT